MTQETRTNQIISLPTAPTQPERVQPNWGRRTVQILAGGSAILIGLGLIPVIGPLSAIIASMGAAILIHGIFQGMDLPLQLSNLFSTPTIPANEIATSHFEVLTDPSEQINRDETFWKQAAGLTTLFYALVCWNGYSKSNDGQDLISLNHQSSSKTINSNEKTSPLCINANLQIPPAIPTDHNQIESLTQTLHLLCANPISSSPLRWNPLLIGQEILPPFHSDPLSIDALSRSLGLTPPLQLKPIPSAINPQLIPSLSPLMPLENNTPSAIIPYPLTHSQILVPIVTQWAIATIATAIKNHIFPNLNPLGNTTASTCPALYNQPLIIPDTQESTLYTPQNTDTNTTNIPENIESLIEISKDHIHGMEKRTHRLKNDWMIQRKAMEQRTSNPIIRQTTYRLKKTAEIITTGVTKYLWPATTFTLQTIFETALVGTRDFAIPAATKYASWKYNKITTRLQNTYERISTGVIEYLWPATTFTLQTIFKTTLVGIRDYAIPAMKRYLSWHQEDMNRRLQNDRILKPITDMTLKIGAEWSLNILKNQMHRTSDELIWLWKTTVSGIKQLYTLLKPKTDPKPTHMKALDLYPNNWTNQCLTTWTPSHIFYPTLTLSSPIPRLTQDKKYRVKTPLPKTNSSSYLDASNPSQPENHSTKRFTWLRYPLLLTAEPIDSHTIAINHPAQEVVDISDEPPSLGTNIPIENMKPSSENLDEIPQTPVKKLKSKQCSASLVPFLEHLFKMQNTCSTKPPRKKQKAVKIQNKAPALNIDAFLQDIDKTNKELAADEKTFETIKETVATLMRNYPSVDTFKKKTEHLENFIKKDQIKFDQIQKYTENTINEKDIANIITEIEKILNKENKDEKKFNEILNRFESIASDNSIPNIDTLIREIEKLENDLKNDEERFQQSRDAVDKIMNGPSVDSKAQFQDQYEKFTRDFTKKTIILMALILYFNEQKSKKLSADF